MHIGGLSLPLLKHILLLNMYLFTLNVLPFNLHHYSRV